ncbi:MAG: hypothetical protein PVF54_05645 [Anaerolineae bacterium]
MSDPQLEQQLEDLFRQTGEAHHQAFIEAGGTDPEWPLWYADYALERPQELLDAGFTKSQLVYLIITAANEQQFRAPGADWASYYARFFADRYAHGGQHGIDRLS